MTAALCAVFFVSGAAALAFEVLWFHQAALALGSSVSASSAVLAGYMTGLGLGSALAGRHGDRLRDPVRAFAVLELVVGVAGIALVLGLPALVGPIAGLTGPLADWPGALAAARWALASALLLVPTTAMGATLPLLVRAAAREPADFRGALGLLYGANTLGAVAGVLGTELWGLGALGVRGSAAAAGTGNLLAAGAALWLAPRFTPARRPAAPRTAERPAAGAAWLLASFAVGFGTLALEVAGFRFLSLFVVTRASAFAWMLAVVLTGIALGGLAGGRVARGRDGAAAAGPVALLAAAATAGAYALFPWIAGVPGPTKLDRGRDVLPLAVALLGPPSLLSGALFPLLGAGVRRHARSAARAAGALALANTAGAAAGALGARFALLPGLGTERAFFAIALLYAAVGAGVARGGRTRIPLAAAAAVALLGLALFPFGALRERHLDAALATYADDDARVVRVREGLDHTVVWLETRFLGEPYFHRLVTDSFSMSATDVHARRYMKLFAVLPTALHPEVREALLVSYGVGSTAEALLAAPGLEHLDVVDTSRAILAGQDVVFPDPAERPLADPRVDVHVEDGRHFLARTGRRYDLISGEPPPPMIAGVVHLYTREYFGLARERLAPGGMLTYWLPLRALSDTAARAVVRGFCAVFPDCSLWHGMGFELVLLGTNDAPGPPVSEAQFRRIWRHPETAAELAALGLELPEQLGATFIASAPDLVDAVGSGPALSDDRPRLITAPPSSPERQGALYASWFDPALAHERFAKSALVARLWPLRLRRDSGPFFGLQHLLDTFTPGARRDVWSERLGDLHAVLAGTGLRTPAQWLLGTDADLQGILARASREALRRPEAQLHLGLGRLAARDYAGAAEALARAERSLEHAAHAAPLRVFALCMAGRRDAARRAARALVPRLGTGPRTRDYWLWMGETFGVGPAARR